MTRGTKQSSSAHEKRTRVDHPFLESVELVAVVQLPAAGDAGLNEIDERRALGHEPAIDLALSRRWDCKLRQATVTHGTSTDPVIDHESASPAHPLIKQFRTRPSRQLRMDFELSTQIDFVLELSAADDCDAPGCPTGHVHMSVTKQVGDNQRVSDLEARLVASATDPTRAPDFITALLDAPVLVAGEIHSEALGGEVGVISATLPPLVRADGTSVQPFFTSLARLQETLKAVPDYETRYVTIRCRDLWQMTQGSTLVQPTLGIREGVSSGRDRATPRRCRGDDAARHHRADTGTGGSPRAHTGRHGAISWRSVQQARNC